MNLHKMSNILMNEVDGNGNDLGGAAPDSILAGAGSQQDPAPPEGTQTPPADQAKDNYDWIPEKFRVMSADGLEVDVTQSAQKLAASYDGLSKRLGSGDIPPKDAESYQVDLGEESIISFDEFKAEPENQEFLKKAHELGMTEKQMQFVLSEYANRLPEIIQAGKDVTVEFAQEALSKVWKTEAELNTNLKNAYQAFQRYAAPEDKPLIDQIGNNPLVIKLLANIGKNLQEDTPTRTSAGISQDDVKGLMRSEAYRNPNHQDYKAVHARVRDFYSKNYGDQVVGG